GGIQHLALPEGEILFGLEEGEVPQYFRHLEGGAGLDFVHVVPVAAVPGLVVETGGAGAQDLVNLVHRLIVDHVPEADVSGVIGGDHNDHVGGQQTHNVELCRCSRDLPFLDGFDPSYPVSGVYGQLAYLEHPSHLLSLISFIITFRKKQRPGAIRFSAGSGTAGYRRPGPDNPGPPPGAGPPPGPWRESPVGSDRPGSSLPPG